MPVEYLFLSEQKQILYSRQFVSLSEGSIVKEGSSCYFPCDVGVDSIIHLSAIRTAYLRPPPCGHLPSVSQLKPKVHFLDLYLQLFGTIVVLLGILMVSHVVRVGFPVRICTTQIAAIVFMRDPVTLIFDVNVNLVDASL